MAGLLDGLLDQWRAYAASREGMSPPFVPMPAGADPVAAVDGADPIAEAEAARLAAAGKLGKRRAIAAPVVDEAPAPAAAVSGMGPLPGMLMNGGGMPGGAQGDGFRSPYDEADPAAVAQGAREAAAGRMAGRRRTAFTGLDNGGLPFAGMLSQSGLQNPMMNPTSAGGDAPAASAEAAGPPMPADLPPSTNDPMANEPQVFSGGVPLPRPRPVSPATSGAAPLAIGAPAATEEYSATEAKPAAAAPAAAAAAPEGPGFFSRISDALNKNPSTLLALGAGFSGAPSFGTGMRRAFSAATPAVAADRAASLKQDSISATYRALIARNVPPAEALAAVYNPDVMKAVAGKYFETKPRQHMVIKDSLQNETPVSFDPNTGKYYDMAGKEMTADGGPGGGTSAAAKMEPNYDPETRRDEAFLGALDPLTRSAVKDIADGKLPSTGRNMQKLMPLVARYENGFDNTTYQRRQNLEKSYYGGGKAQEAIKSANTTIAHGIQLNKAIEDLHNFETLPGFMNPLTGKVAEQFSKPYQDALKRFTANSDLYARELDFALTGKSTVSGQTHIRELFDKYGSPVANKAAMQQTLEMLQKRIEEHENTYRAGMGKNSTAPVFGDMLTRRDSLNRLLGQDTGGGRSSHGDTGDAPAKTAVPAPGNYVYDPASKRLVPAK